MVATKIPFSFYLLIILGFFTLGYFFIHYLFVNGVLYFMVVEGLFYYTFCRYSCVVRVQNDKIIVQYLFPWQRNIVISLNDFTAFDFIKGFYSFGENTVGIGGINYCYDRLFLYKNSDKNDDQLVIKINTRIFYFNKIIESVRKKGIKYLSKGNVI